MLSRAPKFLIASGLCLAGMMLASPATAQDETKPAPARPDLYDEAANAADQITEALAKAKSENRHVLIQWGADWCGWCHLLHGVFKEDREIARKLLYEYDVVLIDVGRFDKHLDVAEQYGADFKGNGVPFLTILDSNGRVVVNQETGSLEDGPKHDPAKVLAFLTEHQADYLPAESILNEGLAKAAEQNKLAFVHFGAPWCGWCHRLEDWMAQPEIRKLLDKDFVDIKIDTDRTIGGQELFQKMTKGKRSGIPWFAVMTPDAEVLADAFRMDGNNIGCPYTDEEIAAFGQLLGEVAVNLTKADITTLTRSLQAAREDKGD